jgi:hypothetical protein
MEIGNSRIRATLRWSRRLGKAWPELLLAAALLALSLQIIPSLRTILWQTLDVRQWSRIGWLAMNVVVVFILFGVRFGPNVIVIMREQKKKKKRMASSVSNLNAVGGAPSNNDYEVRRQREWVNRAKKRLPWH